MLARLMGQSDGGIATTVLYRPVNGAELRLVKQSGWKRFPARLADQPFFYPVATDAYARQIALEWNVKQYGEGHVLRFAVESDFLERYSLQRAGGTQHVEYWIPAQELDAFNDHIVGRIELIASYTRSGEET